VYVNQVRERSPIIGVKLADNKSHLRTKTHKQDRPAPVSKKLAKQRKTKQQMEMLNQQVQQLQYEINKHKQTEERLKRQVIDLTTELSATNKQLRQNAIVSKQIEQAPKQQIIEVPAAKKQPSPKESTAKPQIKQQAKKSFNRRINTRKQSGRILRNKTEQVKPSKEHREQPLDIERLKSIADLAKQIQPRPRKSS
jgi:hypothetical protein